MAMGDSIAPDAPANNSAERALIDYLDGLLHDDVAAVAPLREIAVESVRDLGAGNVRPLADARSARPVRVVEALQTFAEPRPFAEPTRPLRIPLPPVAPPSVAAPVEVRTEASINARVETPVETRVEAPVRAPVEIPVQAPVISPPAIESKSVVEPAPVMETPAPVVEVDNPAPPSWGANGRPQWAQKPFECLLFKSGGLTLAVPLVELGSIYPLEEGDIAQIFGQIDWFLGLMRTKYGNLRVVDTARVVMPERYCDEMTAGYHFVLSLSNSDWGLGIDAIDGTTLLDPEAVRWRSSDRSKRPWLAGTVVEKMCALLDVAQMRWMFDQLDRKRRAPSQ
jgi:purine-binding chemotaxis protein CheW